MLTGGTSWSEKPAVTPAGEMSAALKTLADNRLTYIGNEDRKYLIERVDLAAAHSSLT
jgi:hypothetical protein